MPYRPRREARRPAHGLGDEALAKKRPALQLTDLERFRDLVGTGPEGLWAALGTLVACLDDHLVIVDQTAFGIDRPFRLVVFTARDSAATELYVAATQDGAVIVGRCDRLDRFRVRFLSSFEPLWHEVTSVAVTDRGRYLGDRLDLWIGVRRSPQTGSPGEEPEKVAYHGLVWLDEDGEPQLEPARDDLPLLPGESDWPPGPARLPEWFSTWNVVRTDPDLQAKLPAAAGDAIRTAEQRTGLDVAAVAWEPEAVCYAIGDEIELARLDGRSEPVRLMAGERATALALTVSPAAGCRGIAALDARRLIAFSLDDDELLRQDWSQSRDDFPTALAFMAPSPPGNGTSWPDLLVTYVDGRIERLRHVGRDEIRATWDQCWEQLGLETAELRIAAARKQVDTPDEQRSAALVGVVEQVLREAKDARPKVLDGWLTSVTDLFRPAESARVLRPGVGRLLQALEEYGKTELRNQPRLSGGGHFLPALLFQIYSRKVQVLIREHIDRSVRGMDWSDGAREDPSVGELRRRSQRSRVDFWDKKPKTPEERIDDAAFAMERWANAYFQSDTSRLPEPLRERRLSALTTIEGADENADHRLVVADQSEIKLFAVDHRGKLPLEEKLRGRLTDEVVCGLGVHESRHLLALGRSGFLYLLRIDGHEMKQLASLSLREHGRAWAMASCRAVGGGTLVAVILGRHRRSSLALCRVRGVEVEELGHHPLDLPWVRTVDLSAVGDGGYRLAVAANQAAPVVFYDLHPEGGLGAPRWFRVLTSGTMAVRFSADPAFALAGELNGLLWCADLGAEPGVYDLRWTYNLDGAIRSIEAVTVDGEPHFLAGAENGKLVLLRAADGRRILKERLHESIQDVVKVGSEGALVVVAMRGGWVDAFARLEASDRQQALDRAGQDLEALQSIPRIELGEEWNRADAESVRVFQGIRLGDAFPSLLGRFPSRETHARILRFLAQREAPPPDTMVDIVRRLTFRDLALFLSYLPDDHEGWLPIIEERLRHPHRTRARGDDSARAAMAAMVTWLQRLGRRQPGVGELLEAWPRQGFPSHRWLHIEFARLLVQATDRERKRQHPDGEDVEIFPQLLPALFDLPPALIPTVAAVVPHRSSTEMDLRVLNNLLEGLLHPVRSLAKHFEYLVQRFRPGNGEGDCPQLLAALIELHHAPGKHRDEEWRQWRRAGLGTLSSVAERLQALSSVRPPGDALAEALRAFLDRWRPTDDHEALEDRIVAIEQARRALDKPRPQLKGEADHPWHPLRSRFIEMTRALVDATWTEELAYLLHQVRPRLSVVSAHHDDHHHVRLRLCVEAEGFRHLNDVSIVFDADGEGGLREPGNVDDRHDALVYPGRFSTREIHLHGYVAPGQTEVTIRASLQDAGGYRHEESWRIPIPPPPARTEGPFALPNALPRTYEMFRDAVLNTRSQVMFAVVDVELGRDRLIADWQGRFPGRALDLDQVLRDSGPGRRYADRRLDVALIQGKIDKAFADSAGEGGENRSAKQEPFLVGPTGELIQRLLDSRQEAVLEDWLAALRTRVRGKARPPLVVVVSSDHGCRLRAMGLEPIDEIVAHRFTTGEEQGSLGTEALGEIRALIRKHTSLGETEAERRIEELGRDLRLILRWLRRVSEAPRGRHPTVRSVLDEEPNRKLLRDELASLPPFDLICALVGSGAQTQVKTSEVVPGHVSAQDLSSSTAGKRLIAAGVAFTTTTLGDLKRARNRPPELWIQGLARSRQTLAPHTNLLGVVNARKWSERKETFQRLRRRGIGILEGDVFRTRSPYRELIEGLYRAAETPLERRDGEVYAALKGRGRSPAEAVVPTEVAEMKIEHLAQLMPGAARSELEKLRRLAGYWGGPKTDDLESALKALFHPEPLRCVAPAADRWDLPLAGLDLPVFGVGELPGLDDAADPDPETFVVWVAAPTPNVIDVVGGAADDAKGRRERMEHADKTRTPVRRTPRVFLLGPGVEDLRPDPSHRVAVLGLADACHAAWDGSLVDGLRRRARAQLRLTAFSPFQTEGALLPGSPIFVGREEEIEFIKNGARKVSLLIVGGRRVGKTSLLNQVYYWSRGQSDLQPIYVDLQGVGTREEFLLALRGEAEQPHLDEAVRAALHSEKTHARTYLRDVAGAARRTDRLAIFFFNEIDALVEQDRDLIVTWRGINDQGLARFLMVGYSVTGELGTPQSPFFHFTRGNRFGGRAMAPTALEPREAEQLLDQLSTSDLDLRWRSKEEREEAVKELLARSYRIPWVLQRYCQLLVERLEKDRQELITWDDVELLLAQEGQVVWQYIEGIDYESLGREGAESASRPGYQLLLFALARNRYFLGGRDAPIRDPMLRGRRALDLGFTAVEARQVVRETVEQLADREEQRVFEQWFEQLDLEKALRLLTLTLTIEPDPNRSDRYGFLLHILPLELERLHGKTDRRLDTLIVNKTIDLFNTLKAISRKEMDSNGR